MTRRPVAVAAVVVAGTAVATLAELVLVSAAAGVGGTWARAAGESLFPMGFALVGGIILARRPQQVVGWLCAVVGISLSIDALASSYAAYRFEAGGGSWLGIWSAWVTTWVWAPGFVGAFLILPVVFPDGRLPSRRWRWYLAPLWGLFAVQVLGEVMTAGPMRPRGRDLWPNPTGVPAITPMLEGLTDALAPLLVPVLLVMVTAVAQRYRRARVLERQQLKWFFWGVGLGVGGFLYSATPLYDHFPVVQYPLFLVLPASIGIAVTRYRLYEIDRVVSRTVSYTLVTGVLLAVYAGGVLLLGRLAAPLARDSQVAVAASTLVVAALFQPVRRRVQTAVDRRFNRSRYDAEQAVAAFAGGLRDEVDFDEIERRLTAAAVATVQPQQIQLWLAVRNGSGTVDAYH